ncbi:MAG: bacteriocin [Sphingobacteriales bacterium]|uniref:bacteriocin n=1 Tax=Hydrotalea flava TaxID=714549 RepID=UPI00082B1EFE|nr:bacteriocin [Hydrotalea flava]RTL54387.1 MAG: bacteriocin [Sphingobacteriales bacterium]
MKPLTKEEMKQIKGGVTGVPSQTLEGQCTSTCWDAPVEGNEIGSVSVSSCSTDYGACKSQYPSAVKATCVCS